MMTQSIKVFVILTRQGNCRSLVKVAAEVLDLLMTGYLSSSYTVSVRIIDSIVLVMHVVVASS